MPELPEVETTVRGVHRHLRGLSIIDVWTDYRSEFHLGKSNIKDAAYFRKFRKLVSGAKIIGAARRGKNVLINLSNGYTILVHMKMTGHLLYGTYEKKGSAFAAVGPGPLRDDPYNRFVHAVFTLSNKKHLALSDLRKFAKVTLIKTDSLSSDPDLHHLGPEPLDPSFTLPVFKTRVLQKPSGKIKQVLMDQTIIAGIGNIYSDEMLWHAGVHPLEKPSLVSDKKWKQMYDAMRRILRQSLAIGGDSESDYRNIEGLPGKFQNTTKAYGREGERCKKPGCPGTIRRIKVGGRSAHFCDHHQVLVKKGKNAVS